MSNTISTVMDILLPFQSHYSPTRQAVGGLEKRVESLIHIVKYALRSEVDLTHYFSQYYAVIYQFRADVIKEYPNLLEELPVLEQQIVNDLTEIEHNKRLAVLSYNLSFAIRTNQKVLKSLENRDFFEVVDTSNPLFQEWSYTTIRIDFCLIAWLVIQHENDIEITDKRINDFAFLAADSAQTFGSISRILGIIPKRKRKEIDEDSFEYQTFLNEMAQNQVEKGVSRRVSKTELLHLFD